MTRNRNSVILVAATIAAAFAIGLIVTRARHRHAG